MAREPRETEAQKSFEEGATSEMGFEGRVGVRSPDREDGEARLEKEGQIVHLEDSFQGLVGCCPLPHVPFCGSAFPEPRLPPSLWEGIQIKA